MLRDQRLIVLNDLCSQQSIMMLSTLTQRIQQLTTRTTDLNIVNMIIQLQHHTLKSIHHNITWSLIISRQVGQQTNRHQHLLVTPLMLTQHLEHQLRYTCIEHYRQETIIDSKKSKCSTEQHTHIQLILLATPVIHHRWEEFLHTTTHSRLTASRETYNQLQSICHHIKTTNLTEQATIHCFHHMLHNLSLTDLIIHRRQWSWVQYLDFLWVCTHVSHCNEGIRIDLIWLHIQTLYQTFNCSILLHLLHTLLMKWILTQHLHSLQLHRYIQGEC